VCLGVEVHVHVSSSSLCWNFVCWGEALQGSSFLILGYGKGLQEKKLSSCAEFWILVPYMGDLRIYENSTWEGKSIPKDKVTLKISLLDSMSCPNLLITSLGRLHFREMYLNSDEILSFLASNFFHTKSHLQLISSEILRLEVDT